MAYAQYVKKYFHKVEAELRKDGGEASFTDVGKELGRMWRDGGKERFMERHYVKKRRTKKKSQRFTKKKSKRATKKRGRKSKKCSR